MNPLQMDVARELHRDRERMVAEAFRAAGSTPAVRRAPAWTAAVTRGVRLALGGLDRAATATGQRLHVAH